MNEINLAQPADSGVYNKIIAELSIPDPEKTIAMEILHETITRTDDGDNESDQ